ncbi:MAG: hypothetical protein WCD82_17805, partial [Xanthobacteraceae bacterium]
MSIQTLDDRRAGSEHARFRDVTVDMRCDPDGVIRLLAKEQLRPYPDRFHDHLSHWSKECPARTFLAERRPGYDGWVSISYAE